MRINLLLSSLALSLLTLITVPVLGQAEAAGKPARTQKSPEEKAEAMTRRMTKDLTLTPEQQAKVATLNEQLLADLSTVRTNAQKEKGARRAHVQEVRSGYEASLKAALSAEQMAQYAHLRADRQQKRQQHPKGARGGGRGGRGAGHQQGPPAPGPQQK